MRPRRCAVARVTGRSVVSHPFSLALPGASRGANAIGDGRPGRWPPRRRRGTVLAFTVMIIVVLMGVVAFAVDLGYVQAVRTQLQRSADASAMAGVMGLYHVHSNLTNYSYSLTPNPTVARAEAREFVQRNPAGTVPLDVLVNDANVVGGDIVLGRLYNPADRSERLDTISDTPNSVCVHVPLFGTHPNGQAPTFFARVFGRSGIDVSATATATIWYPALLPFATSVANWDSLVKGGAGDNLTYQPGEGSFGITPGADGLPEIVMFPGAWGGGGLPPGNFGVIQIGPNGDVLDVLRRQIDMGPSVSDMSHHGGMIQSGDPIGGRTGIKSATKHAFLGGWADSRIYPGMLGRPRQLPLYRTAQGNGTNSIFTIDHFVAVRVMGIMIGGRWRYEFKDTEGDEIQAIMVQPLARPSDLIQVQLTR